MTVPQHIQALANGQTIRLRRAALHREVAALPTAEGRQRVADLLDHREPAIQSMRVSTLLEWIHRNGPLAVRGALAAAGVSEYRIVRELTDRQIIALEDVLEAQAAGFVYREESAA